MLTFEIVTADDTSCQAPVRLYLEKSASGGVALKARRGPIVSTLITFDTDGCMFRESDVHRELGFRLALGGFVLSK